MNNFVSILVPNYNKALKLRETLDSIIAQTYTNWECIIVDDHSTDNSWNILMEYAVKDSRIRIFKRPYSLPKGGNVCRNYAFEMSKGEFIQWFDSDDLLLNTSLENRIKLIDNSNNHFIVCNGWFKKDSNRLIKISSYSSNNKDSIISLFFCGYPPWLVQGVLFRKSFLLDSEIIWDNEILYQQDLIYNLTALIYSKGQFEFYSTIKDWFWVINSSLSHVSSGVSKNNLSSLDVYYYHLFRLYAKCSISVKFIRSFFVSNFINKGVSDFKYFFFNIKWIMRYPQEFGFRIIFYFIIYFLSKKFDLFLLMSYSKSKLQSQVLENLFFLK